GGRRERGSATPLRGRRCGRSSDMPVAGTKAGVVVAGTEVGITGARQCAVLLCSARLCAGLICGNMEMPWWRGGGCFPGGQGVAGSNPVVPTGSRVFSKIFLPRQSQQQSHCLVKWPSHRRALIMRPGVLPRHLSNEQSHGNWSVKGSKITEPPRLRRATRHCKST